MPQQNKKKLVSSYQLLSLENPPLQDKLSQEVITSKQNIKRQQVKLRLMQKNCKGEKPYQKHTKHNKQQKLLDQFLKKVHTRINYTVLDVSHSQVLQNIQLESNDNHTINPDHPEETFYSLLSDQMDPSDQSQEKQKTQLKYLLIQILQKITTISELLKVVKFFNCELGSTIENLLTQNQQLQQILQQKNKEIINIQRDKSKLSIKYKILENQTKIIMQTQANISKKYQELTDQLGGLVIMNEQDTPHQYYSRKQTASSYSKNTQKTYSSQNSDITFHSNMNHQGENVKIPTFYSNYFQQHLKTPKSKKKSEYQSQTTQQF